jgi:hypothetical protein
MREWNDSCGRNFLAAIVLDPDKPQIWIKQKTSPQAKLESHFAEILKKCLL